MANFTDKLYANPLADVTGFCFDEGVVNVFPDMIKRSVPGYSTMIHMTGELADIYAKPNTNCYDLGCSLGASSFAMQQSLQNRNCNIIGIDNSTAMLNHCKQLLNNQTSEVPVQLIEANIQDVAISNASVVVLNFTLQFIPLAEREALLNKIASALIPGGILILSEKVAFNDEQHHQLMIDLHHNFKRANGYSDLEISQKRSALEDVLIPETLEKHKKRLRSAGFNAVDVWFQCFNFASIIALKT